MQKLIHDGLANLKKQTTYDKPQINLTKSQLRTFWKLRKSIGSGNFCAENDCQRDVY
jgi:hypothetical protein